MNSSYMPSANFTSLKLCLSSQRTLQDLHNVTANLTCGGANKSAPPEVPREMQFTEDNIISIVIYSILMVISAAGNLTIFTTLFRNRHRKSRVNLFIMHLNVADMIVTFVMMPQEIAWHSTVYWRAGDVACRVGMFFRAFGFFLSTNILVAISLDRYFAILHPMSLRDGDKRGKIMLSVAWLLATVSSLPQSIIFHVEHHPIHRWYTQCVTFMFFPSDAHELAYNFFHFIVVYAVPLIVIVISYSMIIYEISTKSKECKASVRGQTDSERGRGQSNNLLRRSCTGPMERAKIKTLKMTLMIVIAYVVCWTPYFIICLWWWFDRYSAMRIDNKLQRGLFLFAVSNSCINPILYGVFASHFKKEFVRCCPLFRRTSMAASTRIPALEVAQRKLFKIPLRKAGSNNVAGSVKSLNGTGFSFLPMRRSCSSGGGSGKSSNSCQKK